LRLARLFIAFCLEAAAKFSQGRITGLERFNPLDQLFGPGWIVFFQREQRQQMKRGDVTGINLQGGLNLG
jgi:hypothetical protein